MKLEKVFCELQTTHALQKWNEEIENDKQKIIFSLEKENKVIQKAE